MPNEIKKNALTRNGSHEQIISLLVMLYFGFGGGGGTFWFNWYLSPSAYEASIDKKKPQLEFSYMNVIKIHYSKQCGLMQAIIILMLYFTNRATLYTYSFQMVRK